MAQIKFEAGKVYLVRDPYSNVPFQFRCVRRTEKMVWLSHKSKSRQFLINSFQSDDNTVEFVKSEYGSVLASNAE